MCLLIPPLLFNLLFFCSHFGLFCFAFLFLLFRTDISKFPNLCLKSPFHISSHHLLRRQFGDGDILAMATVWLRGYHGIIRRRWDFGIREIFTMVIF